MTTSRNFPITPHAWQRTYRGGSTTVGGGDAFVAKVNGTGSALVYSSYLGGTRQDTGAAIAVGRMGEVYVTGMTGSPDFPTTAHALQRTLGGPADAFVACLSAAADRLVYATYLGGSNIDQGSGLAVDDGGVYVTGSTVSRNFPTVHPLAGIMGTGSF
jgi:Beta-propeller repeat